jgi:nucleoside-diphosphate-sugar epimerase
VKRLITGAGGFIGNNLARHLKDRFPSDEIYSVGLTEGGPPGIPHLRVNLARPDALVSFFRSYEPEEIYHLAGLSRVSDDIGIPEYFEANFLTTQALLDALESFQSPKRLFFSSSVHVYGNQSQVVSEDMPVHPIGPYGYTKYLAEEALRQRVKQTPNLGVVVGRLYSCVGPGQAGGFAIPDLVMKVASLPADNSAPLMVGPTSGYRTFLDVRDAVAIFPRLLGAIGPGGFEIVNVSSPHRLQIAEALQMILDVAGKRPEVRTAQSPPNRFTGLSVSVEKLQRLVPQLSFRPFRQTLEDMYRWATLQNPKT